MFRLIAFTLIELLVVLAIILALSSMLFALIGAGSSSGEITASKALVQKVSTSIGQFTLETGAVPLPTGTATNPSSGSWYPATDDGTWDKQQLWWRLQHKMTPDERRDMRDAGLAADLAADPFQSIDDMKEKYPSSSTRFSNIKSILDTVDNAEAEQYQVRTVNGWTYTNASGDIHTNGNNLSTRGQYKAWILNVRGSIAKDLAERQYMTHPCLSLEELGGEDFLNGQSIVDAWGNSLIYVAHSTVAVEAQSGTTAYYRPIEAHKTGRVAISDRNSDGVINLLDWDVEPTDPQDHNNDGSKDASDWSSILWNARPGNEIGFFLASAGPDALFNCIMTDVVNDDNIINDLSGN